MLAIIWILNFAISWFNAWGCGKTWNETKASRGIATWSFPHFMNWCGAIMSAAGFTWCYLVIAGFAGATIPIEHVVNGHKVVEPYLAAADLKVFAELGYLAIIGPVLGSGIAITLHSWGVMWRRRTFTNTAISAWDTFAMGKNIYDAYHLVPEASSDVWSFFKGSGKSDDNKGLVIVLLVAVCVLGGVLTTAAIIKSVARSTAANRRLELELGGAR